MWQFETSFVTAPQLAFGKIKLIQLLTDFQLLMHLKQVLSIYCHKQSHQQELLSPGKDLLIDGCSLILTLWHLLERT